MLILSSHIFCERYITEAKLSNAYMHSKFDANDLLIICKFLTDRNLIIHVYDF